MLVLQSLYFFKDAGDIFELGERESNIGEFSGDLNFYAGVANSNSASDIDLFFNL
jgi:hypothetical protein